MLELIRETNKQSICIVCGKRTDDIYCSGSRDDPHARCKTIIIWHKPWLDNAGLAETIIEDTCKHEWMANGHCSWCGESYDGH